MEECHLDSSLKGAAPPALPAALSFTAQGSGQRSTGFTARPTAARSFTASHYLSRERLTSLAETRPVGIGPLERRKGFTASAERQGLPQHQFRYSPQLPQGFTAPQRWRSPVTHLTELARHSRESFTTLAAPARAGGGWGLTTPTPVGELPGFTTRQLQVQSLRGFTATERQPHLLAKCGKRGEGISVSSPATKAFTGGGLFGTARIPEECMAPYRVPGEQSLDAHNRPSDGCFNPHQLPSGLLVSKITTIGSEESIDKTSTGRSLQYTQRERRTHPARHAHRVHADSQ